MAIRALAQIYKWIIPAGEGLDVPITASFLYVTAMSQASCLIAFDNGQRSRAFPGAEFRGEGDEKYQTFRLQNESETEALLVTGVAGQGAFSLQQFKFIQAGSMVSAADDSVAAGVTEMVAPVNVNRRKVRVSSLAANAREVRVGDSMTGAGRGVELLPGASVVFDTTAAVYAFNPHTAPQKVSIVEVAE